MRVDDTDGGVEILSLCGEAVCPHWVCQLLGIMGCGPFY
jgi:hypothetical protein